MSPKGNPRTGEQINRVKEILLEQGRTQAWLAEQMNYSTVAIMSICNNTAQPPLKVLKTIAGLLDVDIRELLVPTKETVTNNLIEAANVTIERLERIISLSKPDQKKLIEKWRDALHKAQKR